MASHGKAGNTRDLILGVAELIEWASSFYTLLPGDVFMTGTPDGVGPIATDDVLYARIDRIGEMDRPRALASDFGKLKSGGEGGIRTPDTLLGCNCLAGSPVRPLQHLSVNTKERTPRRLRRRV